MRQIEDQKTIDLAPIAKRGRPSTGKALSAAKRKERQRERDLTKIMEEPNLDNVTISGLVNILATGTKPGWNAGGELARNAWLELGKRRGFIFVTTTKNITVITKN